MLQPDNTKFLTVPTTFNTKHYHTKSLSTDKLTINNQHDIYKTTALDNISHDNNSNEISQQYTTPIVNDNTGNYNLDHKTMTSNYNNTIQPPTYSHNNDCSNNAIDSNQQIDNIDTTNTTGRDKARKRKEKRILWCIGITILIILILFVILISIYYPRVPTISMNNINTYNTHLSMSNGMLGISMLLNCSIIMHNDNAVSANYDNTTIPLYINNIQAGQLYLPSDTINSYSSKSVNLNGSIDNLQLSTISNSLIDNNDIVVVGNTTVYSHVNVIGMKLNFNVYTQCIQHITVDYKTLSFNVKSNNCYSKFV